MNARWKTCVALAGLVVLCTTATGFINPSFTPIDLVKQSDSILLLEFTKVNDEGLATATVTKVLKGAFEKKELTVDLMATAFPAQGREVMGLIQAGQKQGLLFTGMFDTGEAEGGGDPGVGGDEPGAFLHLAGRWTAQNQWFVLSSVEGADWGMDKTEAHMLGTFNGSTDQFLRCVNYIQADPDADVPIRSDVEWDTEIQVGKVDVKVGAARPVNILGAAARGKGTQCDLYLASGGGDRVWRFDGKVFQDVTAKHKLGAKSLAFAWADFDGDGKVDLASWDGKALGLHRQAADGTFQATACSVGDALAGGCLSLEALDTGVKGKPGLLAGTKASPVLLVPQAGGGWKAQALVAGDFAIGKDLGAVSRCFVADFDGDAVADVLQVFEAGSLFYKGKAPGEFAAPAMTAPAVGRGRHDACLGDFDADGLPDIFTTAEDGNRLWQNDGGGKFSDMLAVSGEIAYISKSGGNGAASGDFNNDGRQDLLVTYTAGMSPQLFFNRGFRSTGHARMVDLAEQKRLPQAADGQQAGTLGDFTGDGALDMVLVLANGEVWLFPRKVADGTALAVVASLPDGCEHPGPVTVSARRDTRAFGAEAVVAGGPGAFFGVREAGPVTLSWRFPGGKSIEKEVVVTEDGLVRLVLDAK